MYGNQEVIPNTITLTTRTPSLKYVSRAALGKAKTFSVSDCTTFTKITAPLSMSNPIANNNQNPTYYFFLNVIVGTHE